MITFGKDFAVLGEVGHIDCPVCKEPREIVSLQDFRCAVCGTVGGKVVQGRELRIVALEINEIKTRDNGVACP